MDPPLLELTDLRLRFGGVQALDGVSLTVRRGDVFGLIGPNGAGKTTLVNLITGFVRGGSGSARLDGIELVGRAAHTIAAAGVARTSQGVRLYHPLSAVENVVCGMHSRRGLDLGELMPVRRVRAARRRRREQALALLAAVGLPRELADAPAEALAYGQQRRVEIARALALEPRLLILDEPVAGMNPVEKHEIGRLLAQLSTSGLTILLIEHDMPLVTSACTQVAVLDFGRKIADGQPRSVASDQRVLDAYLGRSSEREHSPAAAPAPRGRPLLDVIALDVHYGAVHAVREASLHVHAGEIVTLIGANGAGKSTLLAALSGLVRPSGGAAEFDGLDLTRSRPSQIVRAGLAHVPEGRQILARLTVRENLTLGGYSRGRTRDLATDIARLEQRFPILGERRAMPAAALSGGEQQMLAIARALIARPRLVLLDEPSLGLAPLLAATVFELIAELHREGMTILIVEQNAHRALQLAHRGYVIETGRITIEDSAERLRADSRVQRAYLGAEPATGPAPEGTRPLQR